MFAYHSALHEPGQDVGHAVIVSVATTYPSLDPVSNPNPLSSHGPEIVTSFRELLFLHFLTNATSLTRFRVKQERNCMYRKNRLAGDVNTGFLSADVEILI